MISYVTRHQTDSNQHCNPEIAQLRASDRWPITGFRSRAACMPESASASSLEYSVHHTHSLSLSPIPYPIRPKNPRLLQEIGDLIRERNEQPTTNNSFMELDELALDELALAALPEPDARQDPECSCSQRLSDRYHPECVESELSPPHAAHSPAQCA